MREEAMNADHVMFYEDSLNKYIINYEESEPLASYIFVCLVILSNDDAKQKIFDNLNKQFGTSITLEEYNDNSENLIDSLGISSDITSSLEYSVTPVVSDPGTVSFNSAY